MKFTFYIFLLSFTFGFGQSVIEGSVLQADNSPLPFATIKILSNNSYTITNEDGKFEITVSQLSDSIEVTFIGFETKRVAVSYFQNEPNLYLKENINILDEVTVVAVKNKNYVFDLLNSLVKKYQAKQSVIHSKAYYTLTSSAGNVPIEQVEGFYNCEQSLSEGIINLKIKSGRFGQSKTFPFYSLDNTKILSDFQFFDKSNQILPFYPGNMSIGTIKKKYNIKIDECNSCKDNEIMISFAPKKADGRFFSGTILFDRERLIIKKIDLWISNPETKELISINKNVNIRTDGIMLEIAFNPLDFEKIQYLNFNFYLTYESGKSKEIIESRSFVYFYDYNTSFSMPSFANPISFNNDYDKIVAMQAMDDFWEANFQFPKSIKERRFTSFMEENGYLINYDNTISSDNIKYTNSSVISWNKNNRLQWNSIKQNLITLNSTSNTLTNTPFKLANGGKVNLTSSEITKNRSFNNKSEKYVFNYMLDLYKNKKGEDKYVIKTIFDRGSSFCENDRTKNKLVYLNIAFDIYEYYATLLEIQLANNITFEEAKMACKTKFDEASLIVKKMKSETKLGSDYQNLTKWNNYIKQKLNIDNFKTVN
ncbi:hypothetical protein FF125_21775 [Aureibaculum algae]|uniref:Carboxypeptidase-like regulatory domain-containing protein n=1 Tax=Aureibaculum algae TaxID=2584122 RepID=A0A5B7U1N6_9FLAO|nr:carboxypeptidase-like regulatory domain-containing protein [Aureibaculum algae]QCX40947.1 hypothetical protein FF125_21775 [Aureibaculum algae]